jgi:hypothetical protein
MGLPEALPHLKGHEWQAVRAVYLLFAMVTASVVAASMWFNTIEVVGGPPSVDGSFRYLALNVPPPLLVAASLMLFLRRGRTRIAMMFAFGFLMLCYRSPFTMLALTGIPADYRIALVKAGWAVCFIAAAGMPDARYRTRLAKLIFVIAPLPLLATGAFWPQVSPATLYVIDRSLYFGTMTYAAMVMLQRYGMTPDVTSRQRLQWAMTGACISAACALVFIDALWVTPARLIGVSATHVILHLGNIASTLALPLGAVASLLGLRLFDAESTLHKSVVYSVVTAVVLAFAAGAGKIAGDFGKELAGNAGGALVGAIIIAAVVDPVRKRASGWAERTFRSGVLALRDTLPQLLAELRLTARPGEIADIVLARVERDAHATSAAIVIDGAPLRLRGIDEAALDQWLAGWSPPAGDGIDYDRNDALLPMRIPLSIEEGGVSGWLLLGPKPEKSVYDSAERDALSRIGQPVARALHHAASREAREGVERGNWERLERLLEPHRG